MVKALSVKEEARRKLASEWLLKSCKNFLSGKEAAVKLILNNFSQIFLGLLVCVIFF
jgi:hypothetical protein